MSTNTKLNPLILIVTAVIIIFIASIIYKNMNVDNSEAITVPKIKVSSKTNANNKKEYDFSPTAEVPSAIAADTSEDTEVFKYAHLSKEEREKAISKSLHKFTNYRTPEQVMETIYQLKELGKDEEADEYIEFLIKRFPDYEMK